MARTTQYIVHFLFVPESVQIPTLIIIPANDHWARFSLSLIDGEYQRPYSTKYQDNWTSAHVLLPRALIPHTYCFAGGCRSFRPTMERHGELWHMDFTGTKTSWLWFFIGCGLCSMGIADCDTLLSVQMV